MRTAEQRQSLAKEQYGSRRNKSADVQALNKVQVFDLFRLERRDAVDAAIDLQSCYDLIGHASASLSMRAQGAPEPPVTSMLASLQGMVHRCRNSYGVSESSFGVCVWEIPHSPPPQGAGQGNGAGPQIWAVTSSPVFDILREENHGVHFVSAISEEEIHIVGTAFVDDTNSDEKLEDPKATLDQTIDSAQASIDSFIGGINATGGQPRPGKCWCYFLSPK